MNTFDAKTIGKRMAEFGHAEATFRALGGEVRAYQKAINEFRASLERAVGNAQAVGMESARGHLSEVLRFVQRDGLHAAALMAHAQRASGAIRDDLKVRTFLYVPVELSHYVDNERLFGDVVWETFKKARRDVKESGNCLAADCNTAAVFHLMRVSEHGLRAVAKRLRVTLTHGGSAQHIEYADWNKVITQIKIKITSLRPVTGPARGRRLEFFSDIAEQCEYIRDIWRNTISHTRRPYSAPEAMGVKQRVQDFMVRLSAGLS